MLFNKLIDYKIILKVAGVVATVCAIDSIEHKLTMDRFRNNIMAYERKITRKKDEERAANNSKVRT